MIALRTEYRADWPTLAHDAPVGIIDPQRARSGNAEWKPGRAQEFAGLTVVVEVDDRDLAEEILTERGFVLA